MTLPQDQHRTGKAGGVSFCFLVIRIDPQHGIGFRTVWILCFLCPIPFLRTTTHCDMFPIPPLGISLASERSMTTPNSGGQA
jgi:hypothetical protein